MEMCIKCIMNEVPLLC